MTKEERDSLFIQLLVATQGAHHGTRPNYMEEHDSLPGWSQLWRYEDNLNEEQAQDILLTFSQGQVDRLPDPREFLLLWGDDIHVYALYNMNNRDYYMIRTMGVRYHQWLLRNYRERTPAETCAAHTVQRIYGVRRDIKPVATLKRILYPNVQHDTVYCKETT
jgi:hypothetical protein